MNCFTTRYETVSRELKNNVSVLSTVGNSKKAATKKIALWDTGANMTVINVNLAKELGLIPHRKVKVGTPSGEFMSDIYYVDLFIPGGISKRLQVCSGHSSQWDVLIGMDIISQGDFAVSNCNGKTSFTFRIPSLEEADYSNAKPPTIPV